MAARPPRPPAEIARLVAALGEAGALKLIEERGGTRVFVAADPNQGSELARLVGLDGARRLAAEYGGDWIKVPLCRAWRILLYRHRGDTHAAIARKLGVVESTVHRHLQNAGMTQSQLDLFA